jgi:hypothetical protein
LRHRKQWLEEFLREIKQRGVMRLGDDQTVSTEQWPTIQKRKRVVSLENDVTLAFTVDDLTEETRGWRSVCHGKESCE